MPSSANSRLHCSICKKPFMPFSPNTCKDENDNIVHIACYVKDARFLEEALQRLVPKLNYACDHGPSAVLELLKG
jgi:hypothetical protein